ncbi:unnamed protein product [Heterobilharzia americana]|nr:unnamed protein product [Heterobilharzia americana]
MSKISAAELPSGERCLSTCSRVRPMSNTTMFFLRSWKLWTTTLSVSSCQTPCKIGRLFGFAYGRCPRGRLCNKRHVWVQKSLSNKFGHQKLSRLTIAIGNTASNKTLIATELEDNTDDHHSNPIAAPAGSLRNVYPAPEFIPLMSESDDFMVNTDASCL